MLLYKYYVVEHVRILLFSGVNSYPPKLQSDKNGSRTTKLAEERLLKPRLVTDIISDSKVDIETADNKVLLWGEI